MLYYTQKEVLNINAKEIVLKLMGDQNKTNAQMADAIGISSAAMWDRLKSPKTNNLTIKKLNEMLRALGYELVIMPRAKAGRIDDAYVVEDDK